MKTAFRYLFLAILTVSCKSNKPSVSPEAEAYIDEALEIVKANSINRKAIDWIRFREKVVAHAGNSKNISDTYPTIAYAVEELGDLHSYFVPVTGDPLLEKTPPVLQDETVPADIGYIRIPYCLSNSTEQMQNYINDIRHKIEERDKANLKGWIVDLRGNFGGNMWPMIVAAGPIIGNGELGYFIAPGGKTDTWKYEDGKAYLNDLLVEKTENRYSLKTKDPYVAVLTDSLTASSGEAMTVAFKGAKKTKSFGVKTFGVSTGNKSYALSDGSRINLTETIFADRNKTLYGKSVHPDKACSSKEALKEAVAWLYEVQ